MITIDPGVHGSGIAVWSAGHLTTVLYGSSRTIGAGLWSDLVVVELPQVYLGSKQKGNPNDLIKLAFAAGQLAGDGLVETVLPRQWKGTIKKEVMLRRILSKLTDEELAMLKALKLPKSKEKECIDAIGIGLWKLGRL